MTDVECDCPEAKKARKIEDHIQRAKMAVTEMFGEQSKKEGYKPVSDDCIEIMFYAIEQIAYQKIHMASFVLPSGAKAKLTRGGKGSIKVERSETKKAAKTVEERL